MKVMSLDIATNMGVAVGMSGGDPRAWSVHLGQAPDERRFSKLLGITAKLLAEHTPDLVAVEAPIGGKTKSDYLIGLAACVRGVCANRGVRVEVCNIATVRKHFLGKHFTAKHFPGRSHAAAKNAIKVQVIARCGLLGWHVEDHDAADAAAIWDFACATWARSQAAPLGDLFSGKNVAGAGGHPDTGLNATSKGIGDEKNHSTL